MMPLCLLAAGLVAGSSAAALDEARTLLDAWQLEDALALAEKALAARPEDPQTWVLAAEVLHQRGEHLGALALFDAANQAGAELPVPLAALVEGSARYQSAFETVETAHFKVRYLNKDEIVADYAKAVLEASYRNIAGDLAFLPAERGEKIVVEIYPDARGLAAATGLTLKEIETSGTIAVCKFHRLMITSPLATASGYDWADTVAHEFTHLVISKKSKNTIPIWLHEGIAKFYESRWKGKLGEALSPYGEKLLANAVRTKKFITFDEMHPSMAKLSSQEDAALAFAEVFTVIEFLTGKLGAKSIPKVLELAAQGVEVEAALHQVYGMPLKGIEAAWHKYLGARKFKDVPGAAPHKIRLAANETEAQAEAPIEEMEDKPAHDFARLGELLQLRNQHQAAIVEYEKAYARAGVRYGTLVNKLARAYVTVGRADAGLKVLDALLGAQPDDADAHLLAGRIAYDKHDAAVARRHYEAVRFMNPFNPEIHAVLAKLYEAAGDTATAEREKAFFTLCTKPRPTRTYELPPKASGNATVSIVAPRWDSVRIDAGLPLATPWWRQPLDAGPHSVEYRRQDGSVAVRSFTLTAGQSQTLMLE
ncbi:MAG: tetratricopeptide repeat protein [Deltaproteobacteria bacterium]|nr:tetratricopeptide repeat protein [Deltaproteobacteria bacterium]